VLGVIWVRTMWRLPLSVFWLAGTLLVVAGCDTIGEKSQSSRATNSSAMPSGVYDLQGRLVDPLGETEARAVVFIFTRTDCPISNRYAPEVKRLVERFAEQNISFHLVYPDPEQTTASMKAHLAEYDYPCDAYRDPNHVLVEKTGARITPEAAVFVAKQLVYRGRIDNRFVDFGQSRSEATRHDLEQVLQQVAAGETVEFHTTEAVGCYISDLKK
jgi:hypothetical protein